MNAEIGCFKNEFWGEILKYYMEGDHIWFYDEVSGGLYRLNKKSYTVEVTLTPMEIHQKKLFPVMQITKWKNEIYLIPDDISHEWLVYDIENMQLRSALLSSQSYKIGNVVNMGKWIYLIPEKTNHILAIVEAGTLKVKRIIADWCKDDIKKLGCWCWGYSVFEDIISFPIIGRKEIFLIRGEQIIELSLHIKQPIYSISLDKNGIWLLPSKGNDIFLVDRNGKFIDSVVIQTDCSENIAEQFARIIAVDRYVYLLPKQGGQILVLEINSREWITIGLKDELPYRTLYQRIRNVPYWGCYYNEGTLYTLPLQYRFAEVITEKKTINYKVLQFADTSMERQYVSWMSWLNEKKENIFFEWESNSLENFLKIELDHNADKNKSHIGKIAWTILN